MALSRLEELQLEKLKREQKRRSSSQQNISKEPQVKEPAFLPSSSRVDKLIKERPSGFATFKEEIDKPYEGNLLDRAVSTGVTGLKALSVPFKHAESAIANPLLAQQKQFRNPYNPLSQLEFIKEALKGLTGKEPAEFGDVIRTTDFGGPFNEIISGAVGLGAMAGIANIATKGNLIKGMKNIKEARRIKKDYSFKTQIDKLNQGVDDVIGSVKQEYKVMYKDLNPIKIDKISKREVQDIAAKLPQHIENTLSKQWTLKKGFSPFKQLGKGKRIVRDMTIETVKDMKTAIGNSVPDKIWKGIDSADDSQRLMMQAYKTLDDVIINNAGDLAPDLINLNQKYTQLLKYNGIVKGATKTGKGITKTSLANYKKTSMEGTKYAITEGSKVIDEYSRGFAKLTADVFKGIDKLNRNIAIKKNLGTAAKIGGGYYLGKKFIAKPIGEGLEDIFGGGGGGGNQGGGYQ